MTTQAQAENNATTTQDTKEKRETNETMAENKPRAVSNPNDVASLVLMQIDAVNSKKDELTIAMKHLMDTSKQLVKAYGENTRTIIELKKRLDETEKQDVH